MGALQTILNELEPFVRDAFGLSQPPKGMKNLFTASQAITDNFPQEIENTRLYYPLGIIEIGDFTSDTDYAVDDPNVKRFRIHVHYVDKRRAGTGTQDAANDAVLNLCYAIDNALELTTCQPMEPGQTNSDVTSPIMMALVARSKNSLCAADVLWDPGFQCRVSVVGQLPNPTVIQE